MNQKQQGSTHNGAILVILDLAMAWFRFQRRNSERRTASQLRWAEAQAELRESIRVALDKHLGRLLSLDADETPVDPPPAAPAAAAAPSRCGCPGACPGGWFHGGPTDPPPAGPAGGAPNCCPCLCACPHPGDWLDSFPANQNAAPCCAPPRKCAGR